MKKILFISFLFLVGFQVSIGQEILKTISFNKTNNQAGEATIRCAKKYAKDGNGYTSFELNISKEGAYYINFWMIPTQDTNGKITEYPVEINGNSIRSCIIPTKNDWQSVGLSDGKPVYLNAGINTITVLCKLPFLPEVETVKVSSNKSNVAISSEDYDFYKSGGELDVNNNQNWDAQNLLSSTSSTFSIYGLWRLGAQIKYTFMTDLFLDSGTLYNITSTSSSSHYLEVRNGVNWSFSQRVASSGSQASVHISTGGLYTIRVRTTSHGSQGTATVSINGGSQYTNVPIYNYEMAYSQPTDKEYNSFLCKLSGSGDPYMELINYSSDHIYLAKNDDGSSYGGDWDWGLNPRIKTQLSATTDAAIIFNKSALYPNCTADIYLGFPNFGDVSSLSYGTPNSLFPNLKDGDAIASAPYSNAYRCISWSVGIWDQYIWPPETYPGNTDLERFDAFYAEHGYTRSGATSSNSVIDLWGASGNDYRHASVTKYSNSDYIPHGYDWESKLGTDYRLYHKRDALTGPAYGQILEHYRKDLSSTMGSSLYENVADGKMAIESVMFNNVEQTLISERIASIPENIAKEFRNKYSKWIEVISHSPYSSYSKLKDCEEYRSLYRLCSETMNTKYLIFQLLSDGDIMAPYLINDLLLKENKKIMEAVWEENKLTTYKGSAKIYRSPITNSMKFVKRLLSAQEFSNPPVNKSRASELSYSDKDAFSLNMSGSNVNIDFNLSDDAKVSVIIYTLEGVIIEQLVNKQQLPSGSYHYAVSIGSPGTYLVVYTNNGTTSVKKVIIN